MSRQVAASLLENLLRRLVTAEGCSMSLCLIGLMQV
jgi:hypothetical protein